MLEKNYEIKILIGYYKNMKLNLIMKVIEYR